MVNRVRDLLEEFASKLEDVLRQDLRAAIERVGFGFEGGERKSAPINGHRARRSRSSKRDAAALESLQEQFVSFVEKHPGLRIEQINKELGTSTKDLALPIRKLLADGAIKTQGQKRATTYAVATGAAHKGRGKRRTKK
jgi:predicted HTH transcriptional regulator